MPGPANSGSALVGSNKTDNDNSVIKTEGAWLHSSLGLMSIGLDPRMVWFGIQLNVSTPNCFFPFCIEGSRRQGEFRLMITNEAAISVKRWVIVWVISLFITVFYFPSSLSLSFSYKWQRINRGAFPFHEIHVWCPHFFFWCSLISALNILFSKKPISLITAKCFKSTEEAFCIQ